MKNISKWATLLVVGSAMALPTFSLGQSHWQIRHREQTANQWSNLAIGAGAVGLLGLISHNDTLGLLGAAGAVYSGYRADQDANSVRDMRQDSWYGDRYHVAYRRDDSNAWRDNDRSRGRNDRSGYRHGENR